MNDDIIKTAVIRQELVELTGDFKKAVILNQFIYWHSRVKDYDKFLQEEKDRGSGKDVDLCNGWIYKKSDELSDETMLGLSISNMRNHIKSLVRNGWIQERTNPKYKWDKTTQYRVNVIKIQDDLLNLGYNADIGRQYAVSKTKARKNKTKARATQNKSSLITESKVKSTTESTKKTLPHLKAGGLERNELIELVSAYTENRFSKPLRETTGYPDLEIYQSYNGYEVVEILEKNVKNYNQCNLDYLSTIQERFK